MRKDMDKVLVERPRVGGCGKQNLRRNRHQTRKLCRDATCDPDIEPRNVRSMTRVHTGFYEDNKELNENLKPLRRYLHSQLGRKWDDVYSDIMSGLNLNNSVQYHVWQHLIQLGEVETKTYMEGNTVMIAGVTPRSLGDYSYRDEYYVHPKDGTLRCNPARKKGKHWSVHNTEILEQSRYIDPKNPLSQYHKVDNVWYHFGFREATSDEKKQKSFGEMRQTYSSITSKIEYKWGRISDNKFVAQISPDFRPSAWPFHDNLWNKCNGLFGGPYLPISKKQISSKEVKRIEAMIASRKSSKKAA